ncbi:hypothetical protein KA005_68550, partial [bacterium]|nr:hypothetical protein [bacterium]
YAWDLEDSLEYGGLNTYGLQQYAANTKSPIAKLQPGDILVTHHGDRGTNHALIFVEWIEKTSGSFVAYEENGGSFYLRATRRDDLVFESCMDFSCEILGEGELGRGPYTAYTHPEILKLTSKDESLLASIIPLSNIIRDPETVGPEPDLLPMVGAYQSSPATSTPTSDFEITQIGIFDSIYLRYETDKWEPFNEFNSTNPAGESTYSLRSREIPGCIIHANMGMGSPLSWQREDELKLIGTIEFWTETWTDTNTNLKTLIVYQYPIDASGWGKRIELRIHENPETEQCEARAKEVLILSEDLISGVNTPTQIDSFDKSGFICEIDSELSLSTLNDVPKSANIEILNHLSISANQIRIQDNLAYITQNHGLCILDVKDPANPTEIGYSELTDIPIDNVTLHIDIEGN